MATTMDYDMLVDNFDWTMMTESATTIGAAYVRQYREGISRKYAAKLATVGIKSTIQRSGALMVTRKLLFVIPQDAWPDNVMRLYNDMRIGRLPTPGQLKLLERYRLVRKADPLPPFGLVDFD